MKTDPNETAFPSFDESSPGLLVRAHFAGLALQGLLAAPHVTNATPEGLARGSLQYADALLTELNKDVPVSRPPKFTDKVIREWGDRHGIDMGMTDLRAAFEDAASLYLTTP